MSAGGLPVRHRRRAPERSCVSCRRKRAKRELIRLVRGAEDAVLVDERGRAPGRGAYLCSDPACWERALAGGSLGRALRVELSAEDRATLKAHARTLVSVERVASGAAGGGGERR